MRWIINGNRHTRDSIQVSGLGELPAPADGWGFACGGDDTSPIELM
jgi:hypothetical protein